MQNLSSAAGYEDCGRALLVEIGVRWSDFDRARTALADTTFGIDVAYQATGESRADKYDSNSRGSHYEGVNHWSKILQARVRS